MDARVEVVEVGPSGKEAGLGEVCPASGTYLGRTEEEETRGMYAENLEFIATEPAIKYFLLFCVDDDDKRKLSWVEFREPANHQCRKSGDRK